MIMSDPILIENENTTIKGPKKSVKPSPERLEKISEMQAKSEEKINKNSDKRFECGNYTVTSDGLYYFPPAQENEDNEASVEGSNQKTNNKKKNQPVWISSPIWPEAYLRDTEGENHTLLCKIYDGEKYHKIVIPRKILFKISELSEILLDLGQNISTFPANQKRLQDFLQQVKPAKLMRCVHKAGWHLEQYVFPDGEVIGKALNTESVYPLNKDIPKGLKQKGTHDDWLKNVWELCANNSRLIFSIGVSFAAPCMYLVDEDSGGFSLVGSSSIGKSRCLAMAMSVFGSPDFKRSWKNTSNGFEALCALHNDLLLPMDEGGQADPKEIGENIYMFSQGQGKGRMYKDTSARDSKDWRAMLLSTAEKGLNVLMQEGKKTPKPGQLVRIADIPAAVKDGFGCFEDLHDFENGVDGERFAERIKAVCREYYGTAGREFIRAIINYGIEHAKEDLNNLSDDFSADVSRDYDGQVKRVANRFGLVYAALSLAIKLKVLKGSITDEDVKKAVISCFQSWIGNRGTTGNMETLSLIEQVEALIIENSDGKFIDIAMYSKDEKLRQTIWGCRDGSKHYVTCHAFKNYLCKGYEKDDAIKILIKEKILDPDLAGEQKKINGVNTRWFLIDINAKGNA